ncbi:Spc97/Spc98 family protein [Durotheca rogersii]|uniref:Spc97/Spc98 family protein n=1 Tax=Durotheca rogersii TaxID=419775 RepID=UPI00221FA7BA|nr:Spc97/Spc98 family protein [Durotheca rogersii]KAI5861886.1 Spc97/Spc98 family protein [Durotheca rogersii]
MADQDPADVFAFPDFNRSSNWLTLSPKLNSQFFHVDLDHASRPTEGYIGVKPANADVDGFFKLPTSLLTTDLDGTEKADGLPAVTPEPLHDVDLQDLDVFDDSWLQKEEPVTNEPEYKTWDGFLMPDVAQVMPLFITEAGPGAYDAAIKRSGDPLGIGCTESNVVQTGPYLIALLGLAFGRGSIFFVWDAEKASFTPGLEDMRISGYSTGVLQGLQGRCLDCGNTTRFLSAYVQHTYKTHPGAVGVALAKSVDLILLAVQKILGGRVNKVRSLLQLQSLIEPIHSILVYLKSLIVKASRTKTDERTLSLIFEETRALEHGNALLKEIMREVLSRVSEPWANFAEKWMGVRGEEGVPLTKENPGGGFVKVENVAAVDDSGFETYETDYILDDGRMPEFIPSDIALAMFETGKTLRLLRAYHPEHPLCQMGLIAASRPPPLRWHFDWNSIGNFQEEVENYAKRLQKGLQFWSSNPDAIPQRADLVDNSVDESYGLHLFGREGAQLERELLASIEVLNRPPGATVEEDSLSRLMGARLFEDKIIIDEVIAGFSPHWSLIPYHSFGPLVAAQARVINREYMKLLFGVHRLRDHLSLQKQFHLLGNGVFCSRLSHALFDPNLETAERHAGVAMSGGVMGLRLDGRETWPPASSELRLSLMGVLVESYLPPSSTRARLVEKKHDLPGDISFAVRDLSSEEIDKCLNPSSLEALDFLRLLYKPPPSLMPVFTPVILLKYDRIFRLLLRVLRMQHVTEQIFRDTTARTSRWHNVDNAARRFRFEAQHFVASVSTYFFDAGIETPWQRFESWLEAVQRNLAKPDDKSEGIRILSPDELRGEHERMLDRIMHTLLLRKRQQPVMKLLEDIFTSILKFSKVTHLKAADKETKGSSAKALYATFRKKVDVFITVCRGLSEKGGYAEKPTPNDAMTDDGGGGEGVKGEGVKDENTIDRLLIKLEMSGYYGHTRG